MNKTISKPSLLLHACCAPCSTIPIERLIHRFQLSLYYFGPNIHPRAEYIRRLQDAMALCARAGIELIEGPYHPSLWRKAVAPHIQSSDRNMRCEACYNFRLEETARVAKSSGFSAFSATLTISRHKNSAQIIRIGTLAGQKEGIDFWSEDFKKRGGFDLSVIRSRELGLRRQTYCGCAFSRRDALVNRKQEEARPQ
jgi:epoxyqueuosine reductase